MYSKEKVTIRIKVRASAARHSFENKNHDSIAAHKNVVQVDNDERP